MAFWAYIDEANDFIIKTRPGMGKAGVLDSLKKQRAIKEKESLIQKSVTNSRKNSVVAAADVNCRHLKPGIGKFKIIFCLQIDIVGDIKSSTCAKIDPKGIVRSFLPYDHRKLRSG